MTSEHANPVRDAQVLLTRIVQTLVKDECVVRVDAETSAAETVLRLHVATKDVGKVIGKEGRIASSVRTILAALGAKEGVRFRLNISTAERLPTRAG
jgi:uncharacterized protein